MRQPVPWIVAAEHKPSMMLSASTVGYYGIRQSGDDTMLPERDDPQPMFMSDPCREWEQAAHGAASYGVRVACMRIELVLGTQGALPMLLPIKLGWGSQLGAGA